MRPTPIPDEAVWPGAVRRVIAPPGGDLTDPDVSPVEAVVDVVLGFPRFNIRCVLEPGELEKRASGGHVWVSFLGHVVPFSVDVTDKDGR